MTGRSARISRWRARTRPGTSGSLAVAAALRDAAEGWRVGFTADRVVLYRSHLGGGPPRYEPVHEAVLEG